MRKNITMSKVVIYLRVSTEQQKRAGNGIAAQKKQCMRYVEDNNLKVKGIFKDEGYGGCIPKNRRPGLKEAFDVLKKNDILLVARRDRLSRDYRETFYLKEELDRRGVRLISASGEGSEESDDLMSFAHTHLFEMFAVIESKMTSKRIKQTMDIRKRKGLCCGYIPFGLKAVGKEKKLVECEEEQETIKQIVHLSNTTDMGTCRIATYLNRRNILNRGRNWRASGIYTILVKNNAYKKRESLPRLRGLSNSNRGRPRKIV